MRLVGEGLYGPPASRIAGSTARVLRYPNVNPENSRGVRARIHACRSEPTYARRLHPLRPQGLKAVGKGLPLRHD